MSEYIRQNEPEQAERGYNWQTAIGLQKVDGLTPSDYLIETANANIAGKITLSEVEKLIGDYYEHKPKIAQRTEEADKVSLRIAQILAERSFTLSPIELIEIHKRLFAQIYDFAGQIRNYNISKKEWVLSGASVIYASWESLRETLDYDFSREKEFKKNISLSQINTRDFIKHIAQFISDLWQIHAFGEGNTRTVAVFAIKYLRTYGFEVENDTFEKNSFYFRNALVRANFNDYKREIRATQVYLDRFFENLIFDEKNILESKELHINFK